MLLDEANPEAGRRQLQWDGRDDEGRSVPAGIFIFRVTVDGQAESGSFYLEPAP